MLHTKNICAIANLGLPTYLFNIQMHNIEKGYNIMSDHKRLIGFSTEANKAITQAASKVGLSFSAFCRSAALEKAGQIVDAKQPQCD